MTEDEFWGHIKATRRRDPEAHAGRLVKRLAKLPPAEILDFDRWWDAAKAEGYFWNLWGAAYLINGGCSDDGFSDFRSWLVLQGREVFRAAVGNPDALAGVVDPDDGEAECECYPGAYAWFLATKTRPDEAGYAALHSASDARHPKKVKPRPMGRRWDFDDGAAVRKRFPRLAAIYLDEPDED